jgi:ATP-dependent Lon protease
VLLDRLNVIYVDVPTKRDKIIILRDFCFQEIIENIGLSTNLQIDDDAIEYILRCVDSDTIGIRTVYRVLEKIMMEINKDLLLQNANISTVTLNVAKEYFLKIKTQIGSLLQHGGDTPPPHMYI